MNMPSSVGRASAHKCLLPVLILLLSPVLLAAADSADFDTIRQLQTLINNVGSNSTLSDEFNQHFEVWNKLNTTPSVPKFDCNPRSGARSTIQPTSVHELRPGDIDVVAALGDSITAGCGANAKTAVGILLEWRGISWSIGGDGSVDDGVFTLPNMLKKFNPSVKGFSTGIIPVLTQDIFKRKSKFNVAVSGAKSKQMLTQAEKLVSRMKSDSTINFEKDWKLVTFFIGGNDLCAFCKNETEYSVAAYRDNLAQALSYLREHLPRALVNVVMMLDVTQLTETNEGVVCHILHHLFCKCASYPASKIAKQRLIEEIVEYSESILDLIEKENAFDKGDDFTVVAQPFLVNQRLPTDKAGAVDLSYFAPDCFHFSAKGHALSAQALWNNMFEPTGRKRLSWFKDDGWNCPSSTKPFIYTYRNSDGATGQSTKKQSSDKLLAQSDPPKFEKEQGIVIETEFVFEPRQRNDHSLPHSQLVIGICAGFAGIVIFLLIVMIACKKKKRAALSSSSWNGGGEKSAIY